MPKFAEGTSVSVESSFSEIRRTIIKYGAADVAIAESPDKVLILFTVSGRRVQFMLSLPDPNKSEFRKTPTGRTRSSGSSMDAYESEVRRLWRSLAMGIKAKLEFVASGIRTFEEEFLSDIVLPDKTTVGQRMIPQIEQAYAGKSLPGLLT
jgi:hypothetical protein